jgi:hypothetical protein
MRALVFKMGFDVTILMIYMRLQQDGEQVTVHVDDLKISCADEQIIKQTIEELHKTYKKINVTEGKEFDCLELYILSLVRWVSLCKCLTLYTSI